MHRQILRPCLRPFFHHASVATTGQRKPRSIATTSNLDSKYADKLNRRAKEAGLGIDELKTKIKQQQVEEARLKREKKHASEQAMSVQYTDTASEKVRNGSPAASNSVRKDSSPVKPLSTILNLRKIMSTPHTADQVSSIWTAYHLSKSGGTGRGYVCASIPLSLYNKMSSVGQRHPSFVVPVPRVIPPFADGEAKQGDTAYEFYFLQWDFHESPSVPKETEDLFMKSTKDGAGANPRTSTVLFTPLQEYKMRGAFATPYLVLTHYTDLANTHGVVLLRGEITPASASAGGGVDGQYMLNQEDVQLLSMALQKFYLWNSDGSGEGEKLLKCFHETPEQFKWEELLEYTKKTV